MRFQQRGKPYLHPLGREFREPIHIDPHTRGKEDDILGVRLTRSKNPNREKSGTVEKNFGRIENPKIDSLLVAYRHDLPGDFENEVLKEANDCSSTISKEERHQRVDLTQHPFVTIDGADARDFDDAIALEGTNVVWVAIADVGHFVQTDSFLDKEAAARGNSFYFPDRVIPMLPEHLSNDLCSLRPKEDRLVLAARLKVNPQGKLEETQLCEGIIHSRARHTYDGVDKLLQKNADAQLSQMLKLANLIYSARMKEGGIDLELSETKVVLDAQGNVQAMARRERTPSQRIVEEFMLLANKGVATKLTEAEWPLVYRVHEKPNPEKLAVFFDLMKEHRVPLSSRDFATTLRDLKDHKKARIYSFLALRSMAQASYSPANVGHYGLGFPMYVHFTSPIRRYADLIVHRAVRQFLQNKNPAQQRLFPKSYDTYGNISLHISSQERIGMRAERESHLFKGIRFLSNQIGKKFKGVIVGVIRHGFFVEFNEHSVEGFVHVSKLPNDAYYFRETDLSLRGNRGNVFRVGDEITVQLIEVNIELLRIECKPA